jgi:hypothetical protein
LHLEIVFLFPRKDMLSDAFAVHWALQPDPADAGKRSWARQRSGAHHFDIASSHTGNYRLRLVARCNFGLWHDPRTGIQVPPATIAAAMAFRHPKKEIPPPIAPAPLRK